MDQPGFALIANVSVESSIEIKACGFFEERLKRFHSYGSPRIALEQQTQNCFESTDASGFGTTKLMIKVPHETLAEAICGSGRVPTILRETT